MTVKLITYDLNSPGQKHRRVLEKIKSYPRWAKLSESSYAISNSDTPQTVFSAFNTLIDANDNFLVITMTKPYAGRNSKEVIDWLDSQL